MFKTDSQRSAFLVCFEFRVYGTMFKSGGSVAHYLTRRYASRGSCEN